METAIGTPGAFCHECIAAGCPGYQGQPGMPQECQAPGAYTSGAGCEHCEAATDDVEPTNLGAHGTSNLCHPCAVAYLEGGPCPLGIGCPEDHAFEHMLESLSADACRAFVRSALEVMFRVDGAFDRDTEWDSGTMADVADRLPEAAIRLFLSRS